ncbi:peptidoglycan-binding membrane protein [Streptomyces sp. NRRL B-3648]|nr:peptidoglycan-binding membrane protein [Streptomyces sp. NRRL B-3648]
MEPVRVLRTRRFDALAELMREFRPDPVTYRPVGAAPQPRTAHSAEDDTQEIPPVPTPRPAGARPATAPGRSPATGAPGTGSGRRRAAVAVAVAAAALVGFGCALLLPGRQQAATAAPTDASDPDGPGTLRQGDTGPEVADLQRRLLRIPDVYRDGSAGGTYDVTLTEAVARFQLWYGISGDERGVYGDDTRRALESRTGSGDDA